MSDPGLSCARSASLSPSTSPGAVRNLVASRVEQALRVAKQLGDLPTVQRSQALARCIESCQEALRQSQSVMDLYINK